MTQTYNRGLGSRGRVPGGSHGLDAKPPWRW